MFYLLLVIPVIIYFNFFPLNEDTYWIMYSTQNMLSGATLYIDIIETNPPLIFLISIIPVSVAEYFSISLSTSYISFIILLVSLSAYLINKLFKEDINLSPLQVHLLSISIFFILLISPSGDFAQREHIMIIFLLPYIIMSMLRYKITFSKKLIIVVVLFSLFGFNLKPHFFLIFLTIEVIYLLKFKDFCSLLRLENILIVGSGFLYVGFIAMFFREYITFIIPLALEAYTDVFNQSLGRLFLHYDILFGIFVIVYISLFALKKERFEFYILFSVMGSFLIIYLIQSKGWHYHLLPFFMITLLNIVYGIVIYVEHKVYKYAGIGIVFVVMILYNNMYFNRYSRLNTLLGDLKKDVPVVVFTMEMAMGLPLVIQNRQQWASRFLSLWMLPSTLNNKSIKKYVLDSVYSDLKKFQPMYIIFPTYYDDTKYYKYFIQNSDAIKSFMTTNYTLKKNSEFEVYKKNRTGSNNL